MRLDRDNPPKELSLYPEAKKLWPYFVDEIYDRGFGDRVPPHRLGIYVQLFAQYQRCTEAIEKESRGFLEEDDESRPVKQELSADEIHQEKLVKLLKGYDKEFGFLEESTGEDQYSYLIRKLNARMAEDTGENG